jgi:Flp pilus assembly pilin Flp
MFFYMGIAHILSLKKGGASIMSKIIQFLRDEEGSNAAEYALIIALVATVLIAGATLLGENIRDRLNAAAVEIGPAGGAN